jgi:outer membrane protein TolC
MAAIAYLMGTRDGWGRVVRGATLAAWLAAGVGLSAGPARAQTSPEQRPAPAVAAPVTIQLASPPSTSSGPPLTLSLSDALSRAEKNSPQFQATVTAVKLAHEGQVQASAAMKPQLSYLTQYLNTQGNGISPVGRYVTNDGVHVYRSWAVVKQDMPGSFFIDAGPHKAAYMKAVADAEQEVAERGLNVTVTQDYYALLVAERGYATAEKSLQDTSHLLEISEALEKGGEVAHADVIRLQLELNQKENALEDAKLAMSNAQLNLSVLLFPTFNQNFTVVDDLDTPPPIPSFQQAEALAKHENPDLRAALAAYHAAGVDVATAKSAFFPSLGIEFDYGIEANAYALHSVNLTAPKVVQPNLGYFVTYSLSLPVWDWGTRMSNLHAAEDQRALARVGLSYAQKQMLSSLYNSYNEAAVAWNELGTLRRSVDLAARNLELVTMQYKAGETQVVSLLDAENSLEQARIANAAGAARYRNALAALQTLTGSF